MPRDKDFIEDLTIILKMGRIPALMTKEDTIQVDNNNKTATRTKITVFIRDRDKVGSVLALTTINSTVMDLVTQD